MLRFNTIRYMGIKSKLLDYIIPAIGRVTRENGIVCDLMAGSNAVSYALKEKYTVYTNDVQEYSHVISQAVIINQNENISSAMAKRELENAIYINKEKKIYSFFEETYSETYFSAQQCEDIDSIRYAIDRVDNQDKKSLYLLALMCAMSKIQSTPGHFAQFMPKEHKRIIPLQKMNFLEEFYIKCDDYQNLFFSKKNNKSFCCDYKRLLEEEILTEVDTIYLDSPYTQEQYSRFYHILETVVKYDKPFVDYKAKYRQNRFKSDFCSPKRAKQEFELIASYCKENGINLVISYSNKAILSIAELSDITMQFFTAVEIEEIDYKHSSQGKGVNSLKEVIIICSNEVNQNIKKEGLCLMTN